MSLSRADVLNSRARVAQFARHTPLLEDPDLSKRLGLRLFIKPESLQVRGAFKIRGAANAILKHQTLARQHGIVAFSSGNHAQAVAYVAKAIGAKATIIAPNDAPPSKLAFVRADGADLILYDRLNDDREAIGRDFSEKTGAMVVPPFDHEDVIAGQGTIGLEIIEDLTAAGLACDAIAMPASGGGLAAGITLAVTEGAASPNIFVCEPVSHGRIGASIRLGAVQENPAGVRSIQDALMSPKAGHLTLPILMAAGAKGIEVSDADALSAMASAVQRFRLALEPGGACALAAALNGAILAQKREMKCLVVIASGGNVDPKIMAKAMEAPPFYDICA